MAVITLSFNYGGFWYLKKKTNITRYKSFGITTIVTTNSVSFVIFHIFDNATMYAPIQFSLWISPG